MLIVGKKYVQHLYGNVNSQSCKVLFSNEQGALVQWELSKGIAWFNANQVVSFIEYVPPPIKKSGWIVVFRSKKDGSLHIPTSHPRDTEMEAKQEFGHYFNNTDTYHAWTTQIHWDEPAATEDEDTI
jgi:hypothetical protein